MGRLARWSRHMAFHTQKCVRFTNRPPDRSTGGGWRRHYCDHHHSLVGLPPAIPGPCSRGARRRATRPLGCVMDGYGRRSCWPAESITPITHPPPHPCLHRRVERRDRDHPQLPAPAPLHHGAPALPARGIPTGDPSRAMTKGTGSGRHVAKDLLVVFLLACLISRFQTACLRNSASVAWLPCSSCRQSMGGGVMET